jgi:hypothetical protein
MKVTREEVIKEALNRINNLAGPQPTDIVQAAASIAQCDWLRLIEWQLDRIATALERRQG